MDASIGFHLGHERPAVAQASLTSSIIVEA